MATDMRTELIEEIALEGLDGITLNTLWIRLNDSKTFLFKVKDDSKPYLWRCVKGLKDVEFYQLSHPRPDLIPYNRFHYVDPETRHFLETEHIPDDIYPINIINDNGVRGSCAEYQTRTNITNNIKQGTQTLEQIMEQYGSMLVVVATQTVRLRTLIGTENNPNFDITDTAYCILERIARSRHCGESSVGKMSLQVFNESHKTIFYLMKKIRALNVIRKQRFCTIKKPSNLKVSCFLYHMNKFYHEVGNKTQYELVSLATMLSNSPEQMEEVKKVKATLKIYDKDFKKVSQQVNSAGERYFDFLDIPWRDKFPDATPREYLQKNGRQEKTIRHIRFLSTMKDVLKGTELVESSDDEDVADDNVPKLRFQRSYDKPFMYEMLQLIQRAGSQGMSQIQLKKIANLSKLNVRRTVNFLQRCKYVTTVLQDQGRQKTIMYVAVENVTDNEIHQNVMAEIKKYGNLAVKEKKQYKEYQEYKETKDLVRLKEGQPTEETVSMIKEELSRLDLAGVCPPPSQNRIEVMREIIDNDTLIQVKIEEDDMTKPDASKTGKDLIGMRRFGSMLTESHIRRANWIIEVVIAIKVVEQFRLLKLIRNREKEMNLSFQMDQKSMKRLVVALVQEKKIRSIQTFITMGQKKRELTYLCDPEVGPQHEILLRMIDQAKLRYFSISKEELKNRSKMLAAAKNPNSKKDMMLDIPKSALESIQKHQEYRRMLCERVPSMKYDRKAGERYGLLPKMLRIQAAHQYLFHLCYDTHGNQIALNNESDLIIQASGQTPEQTPKQTPVSTENQQSSSKKEPEVDVTTRNADDLVEVKEQSTEVESVCREPHIYFDENTWRRYLPPIPVHSGYPNGWCLISDVLLNLPVSLFCQIVNVCYDIAGLPEILNHKKHRFYPVINLPFKISQQLLHSKKYTQSFMELCGYMSEMGLLSFGKEVLKDRDQTFVYIHQNTSLLDTRESCRGYNKTKIPEGVVFPLKTFTFTKLTDLHGYWENLQIIALGSNLGYKSLVHQDLDDGESNQVKSLSEATKCHQTDEITEDGIIPGDRRGAAGLDSSLFCHALKNWTFRSLNNTSNREKTYKKHMLPPGLKGGIDIESKRRVVDMYNKSRKKEDKLVLSENKGEKPVAIKKVKNAKGNRGGRGVKKSFRGGYVRTIRRDEGKIRLKRQIKFSLVPRERKKPYEKGDAKDKEIYKARMKQRVVWSAKEDSVLLMCRLSALIMDNNRKTSVVSYCVIRDYLHDRCGPISHDKASLACQRRLKFVLKNSMTESNLLLYFREALQDEHIVKEYVSKDYIITDQSVVHKYRRLTDYLVEKFQSLDLQKCSLPESLSDLQSRYIVEPIGRLKQLKEFKDVTNRVDICHDVLRNILHSAVLLQDKQGRTHEMFRLLTQYPDYLLSSVIKELRADGLLVIQKRQYGSGATHQPSHLHMGVGVRNFKVSQRYMYNYKHRYLSTLFEESAEFLEQLSTAYKNGDGDDQRITLDFHPKGGQSAIIIPLLLQRKLDFKICVPDELVVVDMEGFYNFPWGRGKTVTSSTKADKNLQDLYAKTGKTTTQVTTPDQQEMVAGEGTDNLLKDTTQTEAIPKESEDTSVVTEDNTSKYDSNSKISSVSEEITKSIHMEDPLVASTGSENSGACDISGSQQKSVAVKDKNPSDSPEKEINENCVAKDKSLEDRSELRGKKSARKGKKSENGKDDSKNTERDAEKIFMSYHKGCSEVILPKPELNNSEVSVDISSSAIASRTLLSLRRVEDNTSFEDIRIFNAQDNFVVNSCSISVKIIDPSEKSNAESKVCIQEKKNIDITEFKEGTFKTGDVKSTSNNKSSKTLDKDVNKTEMGKANSDLANKQKLVNQLKLDKDVMKRVWTKLQALLPFKLDISQVWETLEKTGVSKEDIALCQTMYNIVDNAGALGIKISQLQQKFQQMDKWRKVSDTLVMHCAFLADAS